MTSSSIGMGEQDRAERDKFENELKRILKASDECRDYHAGDRITGFSNALPEVWISSSRHGAGIHRHRFCRIPKTNQGNPGIDGRSRLSRKPRSLYCLRRRPFHFRKARNRSAHRCFFWKTWISVTCIHWEGRLEVDHPSIPLAEMLLEKMQIVQINEKDIIDTIMLLLEHPLGDIDQETINIKRVAMLCSTDWGLWRTTTMNLDKVRQMAQGYDAAHLRTKRDDRFAGESSIGADRARTQIPRLAFAFQGWRPREMVQRCG